VTLEVVRKVTCVPPSKVILNSEEIKEVLNDMTRDLVLPEEQLRLVDEARQWGWSWQRIASELQGRTPKQLMRIYSDVCFHSWSVEFDGICSLERNLDRDTNPDQ